MKMRNLYYCILFAITFLINGCYTPITNFQGIGLTDTDLSLQNEDSNVSESNQQKEVTHAHTKAMLPFLFYRDCSRNGAAWLYECQSVALQSLYYTILLEQPDFHAITDIHMFFYPKKNYILFKIYDSKLMQ